MTSVVAYLESLILLTFYQIHKDIGSRRSMGIHWGTFQMVCSNEPYLEPKEIIEQIVDGTGFDTTGQRVINFDVVHIGETVEAA